MINREASNLLPAFAMAAKANHCMKPVDLYAVNFQAVQRKTTVGSIWMVNARSVILVETSLALAAAVKNLNAVVAQLIKSRAGQNHLPDQPQQSLLHWYMKV